MRSFFSSGFCIASTVHFVWRRRGHARRLQRASSGPSSAGTVLLCLVLTQEATSRAVRLRQLRIPVRVFHFPISRHFFHFLSFDSSQTTQNLSKMAAKSTKVNHSPLYKRPVIDRQFHKATYSAPGVPEMGVPRVAVKQWCFWFWAESSSNSMRECENVKLERDPKLSQKLAPIAREADFAVRTWHNDTVPTQPQPGPSPSPAPWCQTR